MSQTEAMVMEKKIPGLMSTLTNTAVRVKRSRMTSRLPRIRTLSGMLFGRGRGQSGHRWAQARRGEEGKEFHPSAGQWGLGRDAEAGEGGWEGFPPPPHRLGPRWSCLSKRGGTQGAGLRLSPGGGALTTGTGRS